MLNNLHGSLTDAVRMGFLRSSRPHGRVPHLVRAAADVRFIGLEGEGDWATVLHFQIPTFESVAAAFFRQRRLWDEGPEPRETAFDLFGAALRDVGAGRKDSDRFDPPLLRRIARYDRLFKRGLRRIDMPDTRSERRGQLDCDVVRAAADLVSQTPAAKRVRIAGRIEAMAVTPSVLKLEVRPGQFVTVRWEGDQPIRPLRDLVDESVIVEGMGVFRPSGALLRVDADAIARATASDEYFRRIPTASARRDYAKAARLRPGEPSAYKRLRGSLRGDESDEEFEAALAALRS